MDMKLIINQTPEIEETEIVIRCSYVTPELRDIIDRINLYSVTLQGKLGDSIYNIPASNILYIDSVERKSFLYGSQNTYECKRKLYELEDLLKNLNFIRISKNTIVNIKAIKSVKPIEVSRMEVQLKNGEKLIVTRNYLKNFKKSFGL